MAVPYFLLQNLVTLAYLMCLLIIAAILLKPISLYRLYEKTGTYKLKYYYYVVPGFLSVVFFVINYLVQSMYFEQVGSAGPIIEYYKVWAQVISEGLNPYDPNYYTSLPPPIYGPLFPSLFIIGMRMYNSLFTINLILFLFYLGTVLLATKFAKKLFNDEKSASLVGIITALNPLLWYTTVTMLTTDIFVAFTILLISYLFFTINEAKGVSKKRIAFIAGISTGILASLKFTPIIVFLAFLLSKIHLNLKDRVAAALSCGITFLLIHAVAYYFWGVEMIKWAYMFPASLKGDFSPVWLFSNYIPAYNKELFHISSLGIQVSSLFLFAGLLIAYLMIVWKKLKIYSSIVLVMSAFYLSSPFVHVAYFSWFIVIPLIYALYYKKSEIAVPSFIVILIPRLWQVFVEKELGYSLELHTQIIRIVLILSMILSLLYLSWASIKIERQRHI